MSQTLISREEVLEKVQYLEDLQNQFSEAMENSGANQRIVEAALGIVKTLVETAEVKVVLYK